MSKINYLSVDHPALERKPTHLYTSWYGNQSAHVVTERIKVIGGWIVRSTCINTAPIITRKNWEEDYPDSNHHIESISVSQSFVPDPEHKWETNDIESIDQWEKEQELNELLTGDSNEST